MRHRRRVSTIGEPILAIPWENTMRTLFALLLAAAMLPAGVLADDHGDTSEIARLKTAYLTCSDAAGQGQLDTPQIMRCSVIYEELKRVAFNGDFYRLLAWSRRQTVPAAARD
jgi:hypothetical protein